jgi:hypothetical protein
MAVISNMIFFIMEDMIEDVIIGNEIIYYMGIVPLLDQKGFTFNDLLGSNLNIVPFATTENETTEPHPVTLAAVGGAILLYEAQNECFSQVRDLTHLSPQQQYQHEQTL